MTVLHDLMYAIRVGLRAWRDARFYRRGGCPDNAPF